MSAHKTRIDLQTPEIIQFIAKDVEVECRTVESVVRLLTNDNTVAFIARYRRHETGNLEAEKIRLIQESLEQVKVVESRKESVIKSIGKNVTPDIIQSLKNARTLQEVEDIYAPFKPSSKGTLANRARNLGLDKAAALISKESNIENLFAFIQPGKKGLSSDAEVMKGVQHIIADKMSKDKHACDLLKSMFENSRIMLETKVREEFKNEKKYKDYHQSSFAVKHIKAHQVLAVNRAEGEKILLVKLNCPENLERTFLHEIERQQIFTSNKSSGFVRGIMSASLIDSYNRLMLPKMLRQKRAELTKKAERESVQVFSRNLRRLLLTPPVSGRTVLAIDPGFRHGCKIAVVNENGDLLDTAVLDLLGRDGQRCEEPLQGLLLKHNCNTIALGNGSGCRETEKFITRMKTSGKLKNDVVYSIVSEDGASIYSVSAEAEKELPSLDVNLRSAVSIARRLQNPMLELIKIEPRHIGVGMYQHDMPEQLLQQALDGVLEDCVSLVGVDLNASGIHALKRIAGLNERKAMEIIAWRKRNGTFRSREQLKQVRGIGDKTFEQCAGFVRIFQRSPEIISLSTDDDDDDDGNGERSKDNEEEKVTGKRKAAKSGSSSRKKRKHTPSLITFNKLDSTSIHPESYETAKKLVNLTKASLMDIGQSRIKEEINNLMNNKGFSTVSAILGCNSETLNLIINGLTQTIGYDIRADFSKPLFRQEIMSVNDLRLNTRLTGRVTNVTTFGAFVDIGVGHDGLLHKSVIPSNKELGAGDIVEVVCVNIDNNRIQLRFK